MKKIFLAVAAIALLASCATNDEVVKLRDNSIAFSPMFGNSLITKTTADLGQGVTLGVYAYNADNAYFENLPLAYVGGVSAGWYLTPTQYWPADDSAVKFWAYGPKDHVKMANISCDETDGPTFGFEVSVSDATADIFAVQTVKTVSKDEANYPAVDLTLNRLLTQLIFKAKMTNDNVGTLYVKVDEIKVNASTKATYASKVWGSFSEAGAYSVISDTTPISKILNEETTLGSPINIIPNATEESTSATIIVKASAYNALNDAKVGESATTINVDASEAPDVAKWEQGKQVIYTISLNATSVADGSANAITFSTPQVTDWVAADGAISL